MIFQNGAGLVNFVCLVFEQGDKMLILSSMETLLVECNHQVFWNGFQASVSATLEQHGVDESSEKTL